LSGLYLEEGETFVMTTHRISVDFIRYDMMLTSKNLILLDNSHATVNPRTIPLNTVLAVNAGITAAKEPVITLTFIKDGEEGVPLPMNLLFSQNAGEQRKAERDDWVKLLMEQVVALQQGNLLSRPVRDSEEPGISARPSAPMRGIDMPLPHKSLIREETVLVDLGVVPEEGSQIPNEQESEIVPHSGLPEDDKERGTPDEEKLSCSRDMTKYLDSATIPEKPIAADAMPVTREDLATTGLPEGNAIADGGREYPDPAKKLCEPGPVPEVIESFASGPSEPTLQPVDRELPSETGPVSAPEIASPANVPEAPPKPEEQSDRQESPESVSDVVLPQDYPAPVPISEEVAEREKPEKVQIRSVPSSKTIVAGAIIIIVILAIIAGVMYTRHFIPDSTTVPQPPPDNDGPPITASPSVPVLTPFVIPQEGIWLLVNGSYDGYYGRPGNLIPVTDSGHRLYRIGGSPPLFQVIIRNQDNSGKLLLVEIFNNGTSVLSRSTTVPGGTIEFIVDPITGEFPRATPAPTSWTGLSPGVTYRT